MKMIRELQNGQGMLRKEGEFGVDAWLVANPEGSAAIIPSGPLPVNGAGELDDQKIFHMQSGQSARRRATGPRSELGKQRSSQNALKFGIFSKATLLKGESRSEYELLLEDLRKSWLPRSKHEEILVEKLTSIIWRYRRMLMAEGAEIRKSSEYVELDQRLAEQEEAEEIINRKQEGMGLNRSLQPVGMRWNIQNADVLKRCLELLEKMRQEIETKGLNEDRDNPVLQTIYGEIYRPHLRPTLYHEYSAWLRAAVAQGIIRKSKRYTTPEQCKQNVLQCIDSEIKHLRNFQIQFEAIKSERTKLEILSQKVPDNQALDRLLRYESSLERAFDRTLNQLERAQRMRKGQPLPPQLDVKIS
jgi:hypothetical protein